MHATSRMPAQAIFQVRRSPLRETSRIVAVNSLVFLGLDVMKVDERWLFCSTDAGLNTLLARLDLACSYAIKFRRSVIFDSSRSGLKAEFSSVFRIRESLPCNVIPAEKIADPSEVNGRCLGSPKASSDMITMAAEVAATLREHSGQGDSHEPPVMMDRDFDVSADHPASMLVARTLGNDRTAFRMLGHLELMPAISDRVLHRVTSLGPRYVALHVRHSDYRSDPERFLWSVRKWVRRRTVLLCTDNREVINLARLILGPEADLRTLVELPDTDGGPIHKAAVTDPMAHAVDLLTDLIAMASARRLFIAPLVARSDGKSDRYPAYSGFSRLALQLRLCPEVLDRLLAAGDPDLRAACRRGARIRRLLEWVPTPGTDRDLSFLRMQRHLMRKARWLLCDERQPVSERRYPVSSEILE